MHNLSSIFSKSERRKWRKYGIPPQSLKIESKKHLKLRNTDIAAIRSSFKPESQQFLWEKFELFGNCKK